MPTQPWNISSGRLQVRGLLPRRPHDAHRAQWQSRRDAHCSCALLQLESLHTTASKRFRGLLKHVIAIYPGSFDPLTNGHLDLIDRGSKIFDELIVAILRNPEKEPLFSVEERFEMLQSMVTHPNVRVDSFDGLMVDYAVRVGATAVLRGIRAISDYE